MNPDIFPKYARIIYFSNLDDKTGSNYPKITPAKLLGNRSLPVKCEAAFICYCPMPSIFEQYDMNITLQDRYFIHSHNSHVKICKYNNVNFIVVAEVYGGPMSVTTVEELKYYNIQKIIGLGFVGALKPELNIGTEIVADKALIEMGTTPHYHNIMDHHVESSMKLNLDIIQNVCVWTTNALYREYSCDIRFVLEMGCSVVNMDTSHLYAACKMLDIPCEYYAIVSDILDIKDSWDNSLTEAINNDESVVIKQQSSLISRILTRLFD